jgi:ABC-type Zn uptake system ZnuABC Zn-binding protein ZnuA
MIVTIIIIYMLWRREFSIMRFPILLALLLSSLLAGCGATPATPTAAQGKLAVVATFSIVADFAQNVGGDRVVITTLVGPDGDAHTFEPTPDDGRALANAQVVVENGAGLEPFIDDLYKASGSKALRVVASSRVSVQPMAASDHTAGGAGKAPSEPDPHIWHDVANAISMVETIRDGFAQADPSNAASYQSNAARYITALRELDQSIMDSTAQIPADQRKLVTSHDTFGYYARRYGFVVVGTALASVSTEAGDPAPADLAALIDAIKATGVRAIFAENISNPKLMQTIASEAGVKLAPTVYTDALGAAGTPGATYIEMMRYNTTTIVNALKGV